MGSPGGSWRRGRDVEVVEGGAVAADARGSFAGADAATMSSGRARPRRSDAQKK